MQPDKLLTDVSDFEYKRTKTVERLLKEREREREESDEDQRVRELLKGKMEIKPWWKKINWKRAQRKFIFFTTFFAPLFWITAAIRASNDSLGFTIFMVAFATALSYIVALGILALIFIIRKVPAIIKAYWEWACGDPENKGYTFHDFVG